MNVVWEESYFLTADQVAILGLQGVSVDDQEDVE